MHHPQAASRDSVAQTASNIIERVRRRSPRVHCVTNTVAQNFTANALLALGCVPSMTLSPGEIGAFVSGAQGLLVNLGTFDDERREAIGIAAEAAAKQQLPWVLDPVFVDRAPSRAAFARELIGRRPVVIRLNNTEFSTLAGDAPSRDAAMAFARANQMVVALSGVIDLVTDGDRVASVANGDPLMTKVTAMGCAVSAVVTACLTVEPDAFEATIAALLLVTVAGELAAEKSDGPGTFAAAVIDALYRLDGMALVARAKVS
ncbi:MAG TPA: hydroxyethylthiazole kinase [Pseudolabrys sp.]|nr:hydroxyethylthiazole kinase [Pseudolabrys sp.]